MADVIGISSLKYKSDAILERRRRILRETRNLIAESGYENFNVRDLCARAGIAQKTLYNAFGNKDNVIAAAIQEFIIEVNGQTQYRFPGNTLDGLLEGALRFHAANMSVASYTRAIVAVFYSSDLVRKSIRKICMQWTMPFVHAVEAANGLEPGVTPEWLAHMVVSCGFSVTSDWCCGEIADEDFLNRAVEMLLVAVEGSTQGKVKQQARRWLEDLRENRASWIFLRSLISPSPEKGRKAPASVSQATRRPRKAAPQAAKAAAPRKRAKAG
jgi:AcrR family transcriptional regulator